MNGGFHTPRYSKKYLFCPNYATIRKHFLIRYCLYTSLYIYNSKRLEYLVVCTATATSKNSSSGF